MSSREEYKKVIKNINVNINNIDLWKNHFSGYYYFVDDKFHLKDFLVSDLIYGCAYICAYYGAYGYKF